MRQKEIKPYVLRNFDPDPKLVKEQTELSDNVREAILRFLTREEKMQEANKPLYLKRYE